MLNPNTDDYLNDSSTDKLLAELARTVTDKKALPSVRLQAARMLRKYVADERKRPV